MEKLGSKQEGRILYLDMLRAIAAAGVILIHSSTGAAGGSGRWDWWIFVFYNCLGRFAVPIFFMVSGCIFLDPKRSYGIEKLYRVEIWHLMRAFLIWSPLYACLDIWQNAQGPLVLSPALLEEFVKRTILGPTHFWFLYVMAALYMVTPFLRKVAENRRLTEYFLVLWVVFTMVSSFTNPIDQLTIVRSFLGQFQMHLVVGYSGYYLLGYYLHAHVRLEKRKRQILYLAGVAALFFTVFVTDFLSGQKGEYVETYLDGDMFNCLLMAAAVFVFVQRWGESGRVGKVGRAFAGWAAKYSFGIYLLHVFGDVFLEQTGLGRLISVEAIRIPAIVVTLYVGSAAFAWLLRRVPVLGKSVQ